MATSEVILTDPTTGGKKGAKLERYDLIPIEPFRQIASAFHEMADDSMAVLSPGGYILDRAADFWFRNTGPATLAFIAVAALRAMELELGPSNAKLIGLPINAVEEGARTFGFGSDKYSDRNWELGYRWSMSWAALIRHAKLHADGQIRDEQSGLMHLAHVFWHCTVLLEWHQTHPELDDRCKAAK